MAALRRGSLLLPRLIPSARTYGHGQRAGGVVAGVLPSLDNPTGGRTAGATLLLCRAPPRRVQTGETAVLCLVGYFRDHRG